MMQDNGKYIAAQRLKCSYERERKKRNRKKVFNPPSRKEIRAQLRDQPQDPSSFRLTAFCLFVKVNYKEMADSMPMPSIVKGGMIIKALGVTFKALSPKERTAYRRKAEGTKNPLRKQKKVIDFFSCFLNFIRFVGDTS